MAIRASRYEDEAMEQVADDDGVEELHHDQHQILVLLHPVVRDPASGRRFGDGRWVAAGGSPRPGPILSPALPGWRRASPCLLCGARRGCPRQGGVLALHPWCAGLVKLRWATVARPLVIDKNADAGAAGRSYKQMQSMPSTPTKPVTPSSSTTTLRGASNLFDRPQPNSPLARAANAAVLSALTAACLASIAASRAPMRGMPGCFSTGVVVVEGAIHLRDPDLRRRVLRLRLQVGPTPCGMGPTACRVTTAAATCAACTPPRGHAAAHPPRQAASYSALDCWSSYTFASWSPLQSLSTELHLPFILFSVFAVAAAMDAMVVFVVAASKQPLVLVHPASAWPLLCWWWFNFSVFTWDPGLSFFVLRRCLQPYLLAIGVLLQHKLVRPNFNLRFARSSIRVQVSSTPLRPSADGFVFAIAIAAAAVLKQDFVVIWSSSEDLYVKRLL